MDSALCPGQDLNLHNLAVASPSSWCVYQFRHLGFLISSKLNVFIQPENFKL